MHNYRRKTIVLLLLLLFLDGHFLLENNELSCEIIERTAIFYACNLTQIPWVPMNTNYLVLSNNYLSEVNSASFSLLLDLVVLKLDGQKTEKLTVRKDSFKNLTKLIELDLSYNKILLLDQDAFTGLSSLEILVLYSNGLNGSFLENNYFKDLTNLVYINLSYNKLTYLKPHPKFYNLYRFELLDLRENRISRICEGDLHSFQQKKIKVIDLSNNQLYHLNATDWEHCGNPFRNIEFETLNLGGNGFNERTTKALCNVLNGTKILFLQLRSHLMGPNFGYNNFKNPDNTTFAGLENSDLLILDISKGLIFALQPYVFGKLSKLLHLNIAENTINRIETNAFHGLQNLQLLNMSFNLLGELYDDAFDGLTSLVELYLNDNHIGKIQDKAFRNLPKLKTLDLTNNAIMTLEFCEYLPLLHSIGLKGNKLSSVQAAKVKTSIVNFSRNQLSNIADFFYFLKNNMIEYAAIQKNQLSICNYDVNIPKNHSLLYLDLSGNMIQLIWENGHCLGMFRNFSALQSINLSNNHIRILPNGVFGGLTSLQELNLSSNYLTHVMSDLLPVSLHTLDVSRNQLLSPNPDVFLGLGTIDLRHNQFICECPLVDFLIWFNTTNVTLVGDRQDIYCAYPDRLRFFPLDFMEFSDCNEPTLEPLMFALFVFTTVIIVTFMTAVIVYNHFRGYFFGLYKELTKSLLGEKPREEKTFKFDAYLCYARKDFPWVENVFIRNLDSDYGEQNRFDLCFEERNFIPGEDHIVNIRDAIWNSKKTICIVTKHFLQDGWCVEAFNYAQSRYFTELKNVLIMVVVGSLSQYQLKKYKPIRAYIHRCEYLTWPEDDQDVEWFLSRLSYNILREEKVKNRDLKVRTVSSTLELQQIGVS